MQLDKSISKGGIFQIRIFILPDFSTFTIERAYAGWEFTASVIGQNYWYEFFLETQLKKLGLPCIRKLNNVHFRDMTLFLHGCNSCSY